MYNETSADVAVDRFNIAVIQAINYVQLFLLNALKCTNILLGFLEN
jgi:hypothetical protein